jgi:glucokinase
VTTEDLCLAVDVGGTKMAAGLVTANGIPLGSERIATPSTDSGEDLFAALAGLVTGVAKQADEIAPGGRVVACGVGCGGPMTAGGELVSPLNIAAWRDFPLRARLAEVTGLATFLDNDAKALALGEGWVGAAQGCADFVAMVVSTGVGGGLVVDGRLLDGAGGNAGHIGHVTVEPDGRRCECGARGCLEAEASGRAIAEVTGRPPRDAAPEIRIRTGQLVGRAVASVCNLLDVPLAVVGGSVALGFADLFFDAARTELAAQARLDFSRSARLVPVGLGPHGPLVGAGAVGWRALGRPVLSGE